VREFTEVRPRYRSGGNPWVSVQFIIVSDCSPCCSESSVSRVELSSGISPMSILAANSEQIIEKNEFWRYHSFCVCI